MDTDIIDISTINLNESSSFSNSKSSNFGEGIELLMNDRKSSGSKGGGSDINLDDLDSLEKELHDLVDDEPSDPSSSYRNKSDLFSKGFTLNNESDSRPNNVRFDEGPNLGQSTASQGSTTENENKTWDGFAKFNDIPVNPEKFVSQQPHMSKEELLREKFKYLRKLEGLEAKGVNLTKKYSMESSLSEMQGEYEMIMEEKTKQNSVKFQGNMLMACINGIEFLNNRFDPFDIKIDGWSEQVNENMTDYDDVFGELYDKYKSKATMAPELKLLFQLGGSAMMVHMTNTMFKSAMPGMDDILRQNPDLMRQFQNAAVNSMGQSSPGFSGFMNGMMNDQSGPPPPMPTQGPNAVPPPQGRAGNSNFASRPDMRTNFNDGINIRENYSGANEAEKSSRKSRPEMKGPSDISDILSGLKTKTINIQEQPPRQQQQQQQQAQQTQAPTYEDLNNSSTISISDLKDLQSDNSMPKKSKRRQKSDKNTLSLDI
jgi:hypothetical protein